MEKVNLKDLKIVSESELNKVKEEFGILLRQIEYFRDNPKTTRIDILRITKSAFEFREILDEL